MLNAKCKYALPISSHFLSSPQIIFAILIRLVFDGGAPIFAPSPPGANCTLFKGLCGGG